MLRQFPALLRFFLPRIDEWAMGAIPSGLAYQGTLKDELGITGLQLWLCVGALAVVFAFMLSANRVHKRRKALSEILATGYHINFVDQLDRQLPLQPNVLVQEQPVPVDHVELTLPRNVEELRGFLQRVADNKAAGTWVDALYGGRTVLVALDNGRATIIDHPRTLTSLNEYLDQDGDTNAQGDVPERYYTWFTQRLLTVRKKRPDLYQRIHCLAFSGMRIA